MIKVCLADNYPVITYGINAYFQDHSEIEIQFTVGDFSSVKEILKTNEIDVLILDLELEGFSSIFEIKSLLRKYSKTKIIVYSGLNEQIYAPNSIKAGVAGYISKKEDLPVIEDAIIKVHGGKIIMSDEIANNLTILAKQNKSERLYRKLSNREIEVLRYLCSGKKNNEIAEILSLDEKTISTYKLRLLMKLNVTNLVDLINTAKILEIV